MSAHTSGAAAAAAAAAAEIQHVITYTKGGRNHDLSLKELQTSECVPWSLHFALRLCIRHLVLLGSILASTCR